MPFALNLSLPLAPQIAAQCAEITSVDMSYCRLYRVPTKVSSAELAAGLAAIKVNVTTLNLSCNEFNRRSGAEVAEVLAAVPVTVNSLKLGMNCLGWMKSGDLKKIFSAVSAGIATLDLSCNDFYKKNSDELAEAFSVIPVNVKTINIAIMVLNIKAERIWLRS